MAEMAASADARTGGETAAPILSRILVYPVKSLDGLSTPHATILPSGALAHDRSFALFDAEGNYVNGKRHAAIHRLRASMDPKLRTLYLHDESERGLPDRVFSVDTERVPLQVWLSAFFNFAIELREHIDGGFPDDTDSPGPTIISVATLKEIGRWFDLPLEQVRRRFRTNLELSGVPAFWEDRLFGGPGTFVKFRIGEAVFEGVNPCQRCAVPPRNPFTGENDPTFVRRFSKLRQETLPSWSTRERFNHFYRVAINTRPHGDQSGTTIRVGDKVEILAA